MDSLSCHEKIQKCCKEHRTTKTKLAEEIGISRETFSYYIRFVRVPNLLMAKYIADVVGMSVEELWSKELGI